MKFITSLVALSALAACALASFPKTHVIGTWLLNGTDKNTKWVFNKDETFVFKSTMSSSKGKWSSDGNAVKLVWTHVDGQPVKANSVKGQYKLNDDGSLQVDNFVYKKKS